MGHVDSFDDFVKDLDAFINVATERFKINNLALLGHSMGGSIVLHYVANIRRFDSAAITSGAAILVNVRRSDAFMLKLLSTLTPRRRVELPIRAELLSHDSNVAKSYIADPLVFKKPSVKLIYELYRASKDIWPKVTNINVPMLILHGSDDQIVPSKASLNLFNSLKIEDKELKIYDGLYHEIVNESLRRNVIRDIIVWLDKHLEQPEIGRRDFYVC